MVAKGEYRALIILVVVCALLIAQTLVGDSLGLSTTLLLEYEAVGILALVSGLFVYLRYRIYEPQFLWLFLTTMFLFGYVFLDLLGIYEFGTVRAFIVYHVSADVERRTLLNLIIAVLAFSIGWIAYGLRRSGANETRLERTASLHWQIAGVAGVSLLLPLVMNHYYDVFQFVKTNGYLAYQSREGPAKSFVVYLAEGLMWLLFVVFLAGLPTRRRFLVVVALLAVPLLLAKMLSGQRAFSMTMLLALYWYWHWSYSKNVRLLLLLPAMWAGIVLLTYIAAYRQGRDYDFLVLPDLLLLFVNSQGVSVTTMFVGVQHATEWPLRDFGVINVFAELFMQLEKLGSRVFGGVPTTLTEDATAYGYSGYLVTQALSSTVLPTGGSLGTSYLLELYLLGREWAQFLGGLIYGWLFHALYRSIRLNRVYLLLYLILLPQLLFLPRASIFSPISWNFVSLGFLSVFFVVYAGRLLYSRASPLLQSKLSSLPE